MNMESKTPAVAGGGIGDASSHAPSIAQNKQFAQAHITALNPSGDPCNFRAIHETDKARPAIPRRGTLDQYWDELCRLNNQGYGIYMTPALMDGYGNESDNVHAVRAHYVDLDSVGAVHSLASAESWAIKPHFVVNTSPGKFHPYWNIIPHADRERFSLVQRKLVTQFNSDPSVIDAARVLRLAGFLHMKAPTNPHLVTCRQASGYGTAPTTTEMLEIMLHGVEPAQGGHGGDRRAIGEGERAPFYADALAALQSINVTQLSERNDWVAVTGAFMQSVDPADMEQARTDWLAWNADYPGNTEGANLKLWNDTLKRGTTVQGWSRLHRDAYGHAPGKDAASAFGGVAPVMPDVAAPVAHPVANEVSFLDKAPGGGEKLNSGEVHRIIRSANLPIAFDSFRDEIVKRGTLDWNSESRNWSDLDRAFLKAHIEDGTKRKATYEMIDDAVMIYANRNAFHPVRDYLSGLRWDGVPRIDTWLRDYLGAVQSEYTRLIGSKWLIGAVARIMQPGCDMRTMLILEGAQEAGKSRAAATLAGEDWFTDYLPNMHDKESLMQLQGHWIIEVSELASMRRTEVDEIKRFISSRTDTYIKKYSNAQTARPRQCVFIGTTNETDYLKDPTGNTRFWPVRVADKLNVDALSADRGQLWAEALQRYQSNERWWLEGDENQLAKAEQSERMEHDPLTGDVLRCANTIQHRGDDVQTPLILSDLHLDMHQGNMKRAAAILKINGWRQRNVKRDGKTVRIWAND